MNLLSQIYNLQDLIFQNLLEFLKSIKNCDLQVHLYTHTILAKRFLSKYQLPWTPLQIKMLGVFQRSFS